MADHIIVDAGADRGQRRLAPRLLPLAVAPLEGDDLGGRFAGLDHNGSPHIRALRREHFSFSPFLRGEGTRIAVEHREVSTPSGEAVPRPQQPKASRTAAGKV
jgi:hypothetical protein